MTPQYLFEMGDERGNVQSTGTPLLSNLCSLCSRDFPNYKKKQKKLQVITLHHFLFNLHIKVINFKLFQLHSVHHAGEQKIKTISRSSFLHIAELYSSFFLFFFFFLPPIGLQQNQPNDISYASNFDFHTSFVLYLAPFFISPPNFPRFQVERISNSVHKGKEKKEETTKNLWICAWQVQKVFWGLMISSYLYSYY